MVEHFFHSTTGWRVCVLPFDTKGLAHPAKATKRCGFCFVQKKTLDVWFCELCELDLTMSNAKTTSMAHTFPGMNPTFCSFVIRPKDDRWSHCYRATDIERLSALSAATNCLRELTGSHHAWRMVVASLTERVCLRGESEAIFEFDHDGEPHLIRVWKR